MSKHSRTGLASSNFKCNIGQRSKWAFLFEFEERDEIQVEFKKVIIVVELGLRTKISIPQENQRKKLNQRRVEFSPDGVAFCVKYVDVMALNDSLMCVAFEQCQTYRFFFARSFVRPSCDVHLCLYINMRIECVYNFL